MSLFIHSAEVLYRAWCVAEIVEANVLNIPARWGGNSFTFPLHRP